MEYSGTSCTVETFEQCQENQAERLDVKKMNTQFNESRHIKDNSRTATASRNCRKQNHKIKTCKHCEKDESGAERNGKYEQVERK